MASYFGRVRRQVLRSVATDRRWYTVGLLVAAAVGGVNGWFGAQFAAQRETGWEQIANIQTAISFIAAAIALCMLLGVGLRDSDRFLERRYSYTAAFETLWWAVAIGVALGVPAYIYQLAR